MTPRDRRWKLWHFSALVAGSAVLLAIPVTPPEWIGLLALIALAIGPPIAAAVALGRRSSRSSPPIPGSPVRSLVMTIGFAAVLATYYVMLSFLVSFAFQQMNDMFT